MNDWQRIGFRWSMSVLVAGSACAARDASRSDLPPPFQQGQAGASAMVGVAPNLTFDGGAGAPASARAGDEPALSPASEPAAPVPANTMPPGAVSPATMPGARPPAMTPPVTTLPVPDFSSDRSEFGLGGDSLCAAGGLDVCESFEGTALGAGVPAGFTSDGYGNRTLAVVDDDSARGRRSFRIDVDADQGAVVGMLVRSDLGALGVRHFGRTFMKIQAPAPTGFVHWDAFEGRGDFGGQTNLVRWASTGTDVGTTPSNWSWIYNVQSTDHGEFGSEGSRSAHPLAGDWMCLEWLIDSGAQDSGAPEARFFQDGVEVDYLHIDSERSEIPIFDSLRFGFQKFQESAAFRVWLDEIALDGERIGCSR